MNNFVVHYFFLTRIRIFQYFRENNQLYPQINFSILKLGISMPIVCGKYLNIFDLNPL